MVRAVVDIGPMKTGTTSLARYLLFALRQEVLPEDTLFPVNELWFDSSRHTVELAQLDPVNVNSPEREVRRDNVRRALDNVATVARDRFGARATAVLVGETMGMHRDPDWAYEEFTSRFDEVTFVINARRQDAAISSIITQRIKSSQDATWSLSLDDHLESAPRTVDFFDYSRMLREWAPPSDASRLEVFPVFESDTDPYRTIRNFLTVAGLGEPARIAQFEKARFNRSPDGPRMQEMSKLKRKAAKAGADSKRGQKYLERVTALREESASDSTAKPWRLPAHDRLRVLETLSESNSALIERGLTDVRLAAEWQRWNETLLDTIERTRAEANFQAPEHSRQENPRSNQDGT